MEYAAQLRGGLVTFASAVAIGALASSALAQTPIEGCAVEPGSTRGEVISASLNCLVSEVARLQRELADARDDASQLTEELMPFRNASGAVIAFDRDRTEQPVCPRGWKFFEAAGGRFVVGAGEHENALTEYPSFVEDNDQAIGGEEDHTLTVAEMPIHRHAFQGDYFLRGQWTGTPMVALSVGGQGAKNPGEPGNHQPFVPTGTITEAGGGVAHNNMPPYVALYFCKKD